MQRSGIPNKINFIPLCALIVAENKLKTCAVGVRGATELRFTGQQLLYKVVDHRKAGRCCSERLVDFQGKANPSGALHSLCATFRLLSIKATKQKIPESQSAEWKLYNLKPCDFFNVLQFFPLLDLSGLVKQGKKRFILTYSHFLVARSHMYVL